MGKTAKIKSDLDDLISLIDIIQILKDVASNRYYNTARKKTRFLEFAESFTDFFRMVSLAEATSPLVHSDVDQVAIVAFTGEGGFMADMTAKVINMAIEESERFKAHEFIIIGAKGAERMTTLTGKKDFKVFTDVEGVGYYKTSLNIKDHIIKEVEARRIGKVFAVYPRAMTSALVKPFVAKLLPSEELITKQTEIKDTIEKVILESDTNSTINYLADIWLTCRVYEILVDCVIAGYAVQAQQLEGSLDRLKKEKKGMSLMYSKSKKSDIDKSLREVFTAKMMTSK